MLRELSVGPGSVLDLTVVPDEPVPFPGAETYDLAVVGLGYVGLPTMLSFAGAGRSVAGIDVSVARLANIRMGHVDLLPIDHRRLHRALEQETIVLSASPDAIGRSDAVIICVPTPVDDHLVPDLALLQNACATVVEHAQPGQVLILTSTTYVGTTRELLVSPLEARGFRVGEDIYVAFSPERIDPGNSEFQQEDIPRVVGGVTPACTERAARALSAGLSNLHRVSSPEVAEMTKLYENTFRAVNIALANEIADLSRELGVEIMEVVTAASTKPYGFMPFMPGPGVGGHCIPCDPHYLLWQLKRDRRSAPIVEQAMAGISARPRRVVERIGELLAERGCRLPDARVLIVGVAYKPGVMDIRESPALEVMQRLMNAGVRLAYVDPLVPEARLADGTVVRSSCDAADRRYDLVVLHTLHPEVEYDWITAHPYVLDLTYRFGLMPQRAVL